MPIEEGSNREYNPWEKNKRGLPTNRIAVQPRVHGRRAVSVLGEFLKKNIVAVIAFLAAAVTTVLVPPDGAYLGYFDLKTLSCLLCVLAVVCGLRNVRFFYAAALKIVRKFGNLRACCAATVCITFLGSMLIANDMALLTFLPLGHMILKAGKVEKYTARLFILQTVAANLGGMLTPFGNPQNLYLYGAFSIPDGEFLAVMAPPFLVSILLFGTCCFLFFRPEPLSVPEEKVELPKGRTAVLIALFALSIVMVFRILPYYVGLILVVACMLFVDRKAFRDVDWGLLLTFVFFFVFAGNMSRIAPVRDLLSMLMEKDPLLVSAASCQVLSNVPSAILLSRFASGWRELLVGVNIGGTGTLIASLASLITYRAYVGTEAGAGKGKKYILEYSAVSFSFLLILILFEKAVLPLY